MIKLFKRNKLFAALIILLLLSFLAGFFICAIIDNDTKLGIKQNISNMVLSYRDLKNYSFNIFKKYGHDVSIILIVWLLGISVIGIPLIVVFFIIKALLFMIEACSLFINIKVVNILFIILYFLPKIFNLFIIFVLTYYALTYSFILFKYLFLKKEYSLRNLMKKYLKILFFIIIFQLFSSFLDSFILPRIIHYII